MSNNPVLDELYAAREKLLADAGGDTHQYLEGVRERERLSGRLLSAEDLKNIRCSEAEALSHITDDLSSTDR